MKIHDLEFVRALAEEYARKYNPDRVAPFPYKHVVKDRKDLQIIFAPLGDNVSGVTRWKDDTFNIFINAQKPQTRQNFTLAHELGHYFLHQEILKEENGIIDSEQALDGGSHVLFRLDSASNEQVEREANNFAASLLMPMELISKGWQDVGDIEELARIFKVSVVAMSIRLSQLGLIA
jgi:Zn-dependent peptidase ImmA (M78 family)